MRRFQTLRDNPAVGWIIAIVVAGVAWSLISYVGKTPSYLLPTPDSVAAQFVTNGEYLATNTLATLGIILIGFVVAMVIGIVLAVGIVYSRWIDQLISPWLVTLQAMPKVALAPLFVVYFGFDATSKIIITFTIVVFPIVISTVTGLRSTPERMLMLATSMGASPFKAFHRFRFPYALPSIFSGLKVGITFAVVGAVVGEFVASSNGLGFVILNGTVTLNTPVVFAALIVLTALASVLFVLVEVVERRVLHWHESTATLAR